jgi:hypothetical protein
MFDGHELTEKKSKGVFARQKSFFGSTKTIVFLALLMFVGRAVFAQNAFDAVRCGMEIQKSIIGKAQPNERIIVTESRYRDIGLKNEGGMEISKTLFLSGWTICGSEYQMLMDQHHVIRDVISFLHSRKQPAFGGICKIDGREISDVVIAVLNIQTPLNAGQHYALNDSTLVPAIKAWKIDKNRAKFIKLSAELLRCPRNGIFTEDGGP